MAEGKNILIIGNYPPPYGGVPHHIEQLCAYLTDRGWTCHVLSGGTSGNFVVGGVRVYKPTYMRKALAWTRNLLRNDFSPWLEGGSLPEQEPALWRRYALYSEIGAEIIRNYKIDVIGSYNLLTYAPVGAWLSRRFGIPHVISNFGEVFKFPAMEDNKAFFQHVVEGASALISCSDHCGRSLQRLNIPKRVTTVPYGISTQHFSPGAPPADMLKKIGLREGPVVGFVGRLGREMGLHSFVAAARKVLERRPAARFVMAGQADDLADEVEREAQASDGRMALVRSVPYGELPNYYRLSEVVAVPTRGERTCSSLAGMEAMATHRAVAAFSIGGVPEIIEHEVNGLLVPPENVNAMADAIVRLLDDSVLREHLATAGYQKAVSSFDVRFCNVAMEKVYLAAQRPQ